MTPLYGPQTRQMTGPNAMDYRRLQMADALRQQATDTSPVASPLAALARALQGGAAGYMQTKAEGSLAERDAKRQALIAQALGMGQTNPGTPPINPDDPTLNPMTGGTPSGPVPQGVPDLSRMAAILSQDPELAPQALQLAIGNAQYGRQRADTIADRNATNAFTVKQAEAGQRFQREQMAAQQAFTAAQNDLQRAAAVAQTDRSIGAQQALQAAQQNFTAAQNDLNRAAQTAQAQAAAAMAKVPTGYQIAPGGGVQPIPGSPQATEAADLAKSKQESIVSTDRMIRSIEELEKHGGLEGAVGSPGFGKLMAMVPGTEGASFKVRLETLKSQAFLPMVAQLKGMGALSNAEGEKLTAAIGALDTDMSEKEFKASLAEIKADLQMARKRMGAGEGSTVAPAGGFQTAPAQRGTPINPGSIKFLGFE